MTAVIRTRAWPSIVIFAGLLGTSAGAFAQAPATGNEAEAKRLYDEGFRLGRDEGHWCDAIDPFTKSQALNPTAKTLANTGVAQEKCGQLIEARLTFATFVDQYGNAPEGQQLIERVRAYLDSLDQRIPKVKLNATGLLPTDRLELDGEPVDPKYAAEYIAVNPGKHIVTVVRDTGVAMTEEFTIAERENRVPEFSVPPPCADEDKDGKCDEQCVDRNLDGKCDKDQCSDWDNNKQICLDETGESEGGGIFSEPVFWIVGGAVVAAGVILAIVLSSSPKDEKPTPDDFGGPFKPTGGNATALTSF